MSDSTPIPAEHRLMTPTEVAAFFGVSLGTVSRWALTGRLPVACVTPGGRRRFSRDVVEAIAKGTPDVAEENWTAAAKEAIAGDLDEICDAYAARVAREAGAR